MFRSVTLKDYRAFPKLAVEQLGRINLFVGKNNSGKTSVLEALFLLASRGDPNALWYLASRRGEQMDRTRTSRDEIEVDISHFFRGHSLRAGASFEINARNGGSDQRLEISLKDGNGEEELPLAPNNSRLLGSRLSLTVTGNPKPLVSSLPLTRRGAMSVESLDLIPRPRKALATRKLPAVFISTESLPSDELASYWNEIALTDSEERVLTALRVIEPSIERIAPIVQSATIFYGMPGLQRGGFKVKMKNDQVPIPIGSLGDGIWRLLAVSIALVKAQNGILLIDEIDTGLHFSVMADLWRLVYSAAKELNIQVFATTHSYDCVRSLSVICNESVENDSAVTIHRIERYNNSSIPFSEAEIFEAANAYVEVR